MSLSTISYTMMTTRVQVHTDKYIVIEILLSTDSGYLPYMILKYIRTSVENSVNNNDNRRKNVAP